MNWTPLNDYVLLDPLEKMPELYVCRVVAVGPGMLTLAGRVPVGVEVDDVVLIGRHACNWIFKGKVKYLVAREWKLKVRIDDYKGQETLFGNELLNADILVQE